MAKNIVCKEYLHTGISDDDDDVPKKQSREEKASSQDTDGGKVSGKVTTHSSPQITTKIVPDEAITAFLQDFEYDDQEEPKTSDTGMTLCNRTMKRQRKTCDYKNASTSIKGKKASASAKGKKASASAKGKKASASAKGKKASASAKDKKASASTKDEIENTSTDKDNASAKDQKASASTKDEIENTSTDKDKEPSKEKVMFPRKTLEYIKNKNCRRAMHRRRKRERKLVKRKTKLLFPIEKYFGRRKREEVKAKRRKDKGESNIPHTIENQREKDDTILENNDEDLIVEEAANSYANYYAKTYEPKVLITTSDKAHGRTHRFVREFARTLPTSTAHFRKHSSVEKIIKDAQERKFTDALIVNEDRRGPNGLLIVHLPQGPTAYFRLSNVFTCKELRKNPKRVTSHRPEIIVSNFKTTLGRTIGRMIGALYHYEPEFKGRSLCTFHNQRDFIFFRHHRYQFKNEKKVRLIELGPRFTMKLQWLQEGAFTGDYEWTLKRKMLEKFRRAFHL